MASLPAGARRWRSSCRPRRTPRTSRAPRGSRRSAISAAPTSRRAASPPPGWASSATPADLPALFKALRDQDDLVRALTENSIWQVWSRSGDPKVDGLFAVGVEQMNHGQAQAAIDTFTEIIRLKPDFAEGWNKRATVYFLIGEYDKSLRDCDEVIKRNPQHWGALSGYGQIYLQLDKPEQALAYFQRALAANPNLQQIEHDDRAAQAGAHREAQRHHLTSPERSHPQGGTARAAHDPAGRRPQEDHQPQRGQRHRDLQGQAARGGQRLLGDPRALPRARAARSATPPPA